MKKKELNSLRSKTLAELHKMVLERKIQINKAKTDIIASREKNLKKAKNLKHELSQVFTIIRQKEIVESIKGNKKEQS